MSMNLFEGKVLPIEISEELKIIYRLLYECNCQPGSSRC